MDLIKALQWRYAVKKFDKEKTVPQEQVDRLIEATRLTPTSFGLQPFRLVVVRDRAILESLDQHCWGQVQPGTCSHLFVLASMTDFDIPYADSVVDEMSADRDLGEKADMLKGMIHNFLGRMDDAQINTWMDNQAYIGLGQLMTAAAIEGIDACPMEGFLPGPLGEALNLAEKNLRPVLLCPIGYRAEEDYYQNYKKLRHPTEKFLHTI